MKKKDLLLILAIFALITIINTPKIEAQQIDLTENRIQYQSQDKVQYFKNLSYEDWKNTHEGKVKKLQAKISKMTKQRFDKMKEMQIDYWKNNNS